MNIAYLLLIPLGIMFVLMTYVFAQDPRGRPNRVFALYMLDLVLAVSALLIACTTTDAAWAGAATITVLATVFALNGPFVVSLILALFYPRSLLRWYGLPLFMAGGAVLVLGLLSDGLLRTRWLYVQNPRLGQGYVPMQGVLGPVGFLLFAWLFLTLAVALILLCVTWLRTRPGERVALTVLILALLVGSAMMPLLPPGPLTAETPALLFPIVYGVVVSRYRYLLVGSVGVLMSTQVAFDTVFRTASEGMTICNREGQIEQVNQATEHLTGISARNAIGRPIAEVFAAILQQAGQEAGETPLKSLAGIPEPFETSLQVTEPARRILAIAGNPIQDSRGRPLGYFLTVRDVTEQEQAHQALETQARLAETIRELSTPIVPVMEGILILPLTGTIDSSRAQSIMTSMLEAIRQHRARVILIDITGVAVVDTMVANYLLKAVQAAGLLGCQSVLVGIRAEVARMLIDLRLNLSGLATRGSLQDGLEYARELLQAEAEALNNL